MALSNLKLESLKPADSAYKVADGDGLFIHVLPSGRMTWRQAYRFNGHNKTLTIGRYPEVSLKDARQARAKNLVILHDKRDPGAPEAEASKPVPVEPGGETFKEAALRWLVAQKPKWKPLYAGKQLARMDDDVFPDLGQKIVTQVTPADVLAVIRKIEQRGAIETGRRIMQNIRQVFAMLRAEGVIQSNPAADLNDALAPPKVVKHRTAIPASDMPKLMQMLDAHGGTPVVIAAIRVVSHTIVRTDEIRSAEWRDFEDLDGPDPLWRIPAEKMKKRRPHIVPLSKQAVAALKSIQPITGHQQLVFQSPNIYDREQAISENAMLYSLYRMGWFGKATIHGIRATCSTLLHEREFNTDWIEAQLAHSDGSIRGVYNAARYLSQRRTMMQWWSDFIEPQKRFDFDDLLG